MALVAKKKGPMVKIATLDLSPRLWKTGTSAGFPEDFVNELFTQFEHLKF